MIVLLLVLLVVVLLAGGVAYGAVRNKRAFELSNQVVPGTPTRAPSSWAGAHSPEALLHRRLRDVVTAARAHPALADPAMAQSRLAIEQSALAIDERLIGAAALPAPHRTDAIAEVAPAVAALEASLSGLGRSSGHTLGTSAAADAVALAQDRLDALAAARDEVDRLDVTMHDERVLDEPVVRRPEEGTAGSTATG